MMEDELEQQENLGSFDDYTYLDSKLSHVKQLASRTSLNLAKRDINEFSNLLASVETSLGGLRQEVHAVKQLGSSRSGSSPQQQLTGLALHGAAAVELLDPLPSFPSRISTPLRHSTFSGSDASVSRRSSLGLRFHPQAWDGSSLAGPTADGLSTVEERIYAGIATALKAAAASAHTPTKAAATAAAAATSSPAARHVGTPGPAVTPLLRQAADYPAAVGVPVGQHPDASCATASTVAAAMQELAAATAADHLGQQLQQQLGQLERDVEVLKESVAAHLRGEPSCGSFTDANCAHNSDMQKLQEQVQEQSQSHEQLQKQQECLQQELGDEAAAQKQQLQHQQELIAALTAEVQALKQQQQQVMTPSQQEQLDLAIKQQCQQQLAQLSKQQEERLSVLMEDLREELLDRMDGLQLRLQAVEEEQEHLGDRQHQQQRDITRLQATNGQQQAASVTAVMASADGPCMPQASAPRQRVAAPSAAAARISQLHTDGGAGCMLPAGWSLPDMAPMLPTSISEPEQEQRSRETEAALKPCSSILQQQASQLQDCSAASTGPVAPKDVPLPGHEASLQADVAELAARLNVVEEQQRQQAQGLAACRGNTDDTQQQQQQQRSGAPLDAMTYGAVEARLSVLEDCSTEHTQQLQDAKVQLESVARQLEGLQEQLLGIQVQPDPQQQQQRQQQEEGQHLPDDQCQGHEGATDLAARMAILEAGQQELKEQQQRLTEAQQQLATAEGSSYTSFDSQPSSVKDRIQQFEEQLAAAIRRFAPSQTGSRPGSEGGMLASGPAADASPLCINRKNPGREASLRELLANLQADVEQLLSKAPSAAGESEASSCTDTSANSGAAADAAGEALAVQLQQQLAKLTQNCAELGEAVLQLDLQLQQVEDRVKQQRQQTLTATQSATAATYISKEAAHENERLGVHVQQLASAVKAISSKGGAAPADAAASVDAAPAGGESDGPTLATSLHEACTAADSPELAKEDDTLTGDVQALQQLQQQHAEGLQQHGAKLLELEQLLDNQHHKADAAAIAAAEQQLQVLQSMQQKLEGMQQQLEGMQQQTASLEQQLRQQGGQQKAEGMQLQQQLQKHEALLTQWQQQAEEWPQIRQQLQQHEERLADMAALSLLQQHRDELEQACTTLEQLGSTIKEQQQQLDAAALASSADHEQLDKVSQQLQQQEQQAEELSGLLFSLRVDLQNGVNDLGQRLTAVEGVREDLDILEDSRKAAAARTEAAAAEALEKVEALMATVTEQQAQLAASAAEHGSTLCSEVDQLQQQLQPLSGQLADLQAQLVAVRQELAAQQEDLRASTSSQLREVRQQLEHRWEQLQQEGLPQAGRLHEEMEQKLSEAAAELEAQLQVHNSKLDEHQSQLQQHVQIVEQLQQQVEQAVEQHTQLRSELQSQQEEWESKQQPGLNTLQQQVAQLQQDTPQQQLQQLSQQLQQLQDSCAASDSSLQHQASQLVDLQQQAQQVPQQVEASEVKVLAELQQTTQRLQSHLQEQIDVLKSEAVQLEEQQAQQLSQKLVPLQQQLSCLQQQYQASLADSETELRGQLQSLMSQLSEVQQQQQQQQSEAQQQLEQASAAAGDQARLIQELQTSLAMLQQQQHEGEVTSQQCQQLEQQLQSLQTSTTEQLRALQADLQQQAEQYDGAQLLLSQLSSQAERLQQQLQDLPQQPSAEDVQQLRGDLQALQDQLQASHQQLQQQVQQASEVLQRDIQQLQQRSEELDAQQQASKQDVANQAQLVQQQQTRLDQLQQQHQPVIDVLQKVRDQHDTHLKSLGQQQAALDGLKQQVQQASDKLQATAQLQELQQRRLSDVVQQQDQGAQQLQQLHMQVADLNVGLTKASADAMTAVSSAGGAAQQVKELRDDLEEALGFMAPFLSPAASSLTSPGATPFVSPHRLPPAPAALQGRLAVLSPSQARPDASPFGVPGTTYSLNPMHGVSGYSVTIGIGSPMPGRLPPCQGLPTAGLSLQQQQQIGVPAAAASAASSRRVSVQDSAGGTPAAYLPLSAGLWRPEPHQLATPAHTAGAPAAAPGHDPAQAGGAGASAGTTPATAGGGRGSAARGGEQVTPGGSGSRLTRCASLDSPSFRAAALAGVGYDPTPPSQPSTGSRPFRGQLSAAAGAAGGVAGQPTGLYVTPARAGGSATRAGGSSAGRLVRALSLDSPSFIAAATAGMAYDITPVTSAGGVQAGDPSSHSRFAVSINASDAALRLFDALSDAAGPPLGPDVQPQQQLQLPVKDDSPEHHGLRRLPGGVAASAAAAAAAAVLRSGGLGPRMSASTAEGAGSLRSSAVWSGRDSAVFDNSLYNTPRKRRKAKGPAAAGSLAAGAGGGDAAAAAGGGGGDGCESDSGSQSDGSHSGLVSLTDSLTALQLRRMQLQLQQQGGAATGQGAAAAGFADSPPVTPTGGVAALDGSSPATTGTPVSVYRNIMFEESEAHISPAPFQGCAEAPRVPRFEGCVHDGATSTAAAAADSAVLGDECATPAPAAPPPPAASKSAEDVAAAAMAAGRSYSPAEAVATVRSLAASATPPSLGSWREKRQQQQRQSSAEGNVASQQDQQQQGAAGAAPPSSSCDFAAGTATADSPVLLPRCSSNTQQETPCMPSAHAPGRRGVSPVLSALLSEVDSSDDSEEEASPQQQQPAVLSAELLQQHTLQQQQRYSALQLPWLQEQQVPPAGAASTPAGHGPLEQAVPGQTAAAAAAGEGVLSPMLSELMSLGVDVIDLAGSEADSDLLAVTPDRICSRPGAAAQAFERAAAEYEGLNRQLVFEEEGDDHLGAAQQGAGHTASTPQQDLQPAAADDSEQQQQHSAMGRAGSISLTGMKLEAAIAAAAGPGQSSPDSAADDGDDDAEAPVLRLRGGAGYEPADGDDGADWLLDADESFDLADYGSSGDDVSDGPSEDPWELIPPGGAAAAPEASESSLQHIGTSAAANAAAVAAAGNTRGKLAGTSPGQKAARRAAPPPGWLRPLPVGWGVGSAPDNAFRVALRTSAKPGSGTKTRVTLVLAAPNSSSSTVPMRCEHKLGAGSKRCSYTPGSTVQDWVLLQPHSPAADPSDSASSSAHSSTPPQQQQQEGGVPLSTVSAGRSLLNGGQLLVAHDAAGFSGAWLLEAAILQHLKSGDWWQFDNRGGWIKGTQQAKAVTAKHTAAVKGRSEQRPADDVGQAAPARQLHLSASGIAANCPLPAVPSSNASGDGKGVSPDSTGTSSKQQHPEAPDGAALPAVQQCTGADGTAAGAATLLVQPQAAAAAPSVGEKVGGAGSASECGSIACLGSGFVPLDDVELKLRGSPRRMGSAASRSCRPSPTHKAASQQRQGLLHDNGSSSAAAVAASRPPAASLQVIAALVSRAAAAPVAAWDVLSSRRSSACDLRHPTARRVSGSIAPAKMVPLLVGSNRSSSSEDFSIAAASTSGGQEGKDCPGQVAAGSGLECSASSALTHSSDGKPCRLVRCSSSYLGRSSSSGAQLTTLDQRGVRFLEWAEQVEFDAAALQGRSTAAGHSSGTSSSSSIQSFTEEQLLEAQGGWEFVRPPEASSSYTTLIKADSCGGGAGSCPAIPADQGSLTAAAASTARGGAGSGELQEVPLVMTKPVSLVNKARGGGSEYQLHLYTADKMAAALPAGQQVCVQVLGSTGALLTTQLPRPTGAFQRGYCDFFGLSSPAGDIGCVEAVRVWHEPAGGSLGGSWCLQRVDVEAVYRGVTYVFAGGSPDCWIGRGAERAVMLTQKLIVRSDDDAALRAEAAELQRQLDHNVSLTDGDRRRLTGRLQQLRLGVSLAAGAAR